MATETSRAVFDHADAGRRKAPFRFFDNREKYLQFVYTCNEKQVIADRIARETRHIQPVQPALRLFDAGMGNATVLTRVMRQLHHRHPTVPFLIVGKEISQEDVRLSLEKMADRFFEHPQTVLVVTNMFYSEAPWLYPNTEANRAKLNWVEVPLKGSTAHDFDRQIRELEPDLQEWWQTRPSMAGNPVYVTPSVLILYRQDQAWPLAPIIPRKLERDSQYDIVIAAQPYRAKQPAEVKLRKVLAPLARSLASGGCMVVIQSTGKDPGMEIIRKIWPEEDPFTTPRQALLREMRAQLGESNPSLRYLSYRDSQAEFRYELQVGPSEIASSIGTSTILAAWNAATYVAQIEDEHLREAMSHGAYLDATRDVLRRYSGLWFVDESFVVARP
ncbi:MAG: hypothetical protein FJ319_02235 [SAR202 cluster bacterium]|nr:hypothetical protein [SAR202 cluster bacterium]